MVSFLWRNKVIAHTLIFIPKIQMDVWVTLFHMDAGQPFKALLGNKV